MRDPHDVETIMRLEAELAELRSRLNLLCGDDATFHLLRSHGFNPRACRMLVLLARQAPSVLPRQAIRVAVGGDSPSLKSIDLLVCKTRVVIKERGLPGAIETIHGGGYRSDAALTQWVLRIIRPPQPNDQLELFPELST